MKIDIRKKHSVINNRQEYYLYGDGYPLGSYSSRKMAEGIAKRINDPKQYIKMKIDKSKFPAYHLLERIITLPVDENDSTELNLRQTNRQTCAEFNQLLALVEKLAGALENYHKCAQKQNWVHHYELEYKSAELALAEVKAYQIEEMECQK